MLRLLARSHSSVTSLSRHHHRLVHPGLNSMTLAELDTTPPPQRWMKDTLDRSAFRKSLPVLAARVPAKSAGTIVKSMETRKFLLDLPKRPSVIADLSGSNDYRLVRFKVTEQSDLSPESLSLLQIHQAEFIPHGVDLDYDYWNHEEILHAILPEELLDGAPVGYALTGHLAHMNLNDEYLPYKHIIGQVIMDKNKGIKTVVNKLNQIDTVFRFFKMELIAGDPNYIVQHREGNCTFTFDFTKVYWNSRLGTEHDRIVQMFKPDAVVADVFAGVGPFALPAGKKGCAVLANDLNPESYKYLVQNIKNNNLEGQVRPACEDGRDFILSVAQRVYDEPFPPYTGPKLSKSRQRQLQKDQRSSSEILSAEPVAQESSPRKAIDHYVMNLPDSAITFLDAFRGIFASDKSSDKGAGRTYSGVYGEDQMPMVHCHCFTRELEIERAEKDIRQRVEERLGGALTNEVSLHYVRKVAPNKDMYCISFRLPVDVAFTTVAHN